MLNFQGTVYIRNGITYSLPLIGGSIFLVNPGSVLIINQQGGVIFSMTYAKAVQEYMKMYYLLDNIVRKVVIYSKVYIL